jgi:hypothetical protein
VSWLAQNARTSPRIHSPYNQLGDDRKVWSQCDANSRGGGERAQLAGIDLPGDVG